MSSSKKIGMEGDFAAGVYLSKAQIPTPYTPYTCKQYTYSHREQGIKFNQREG